MAWPRQAAKDGDLKERANKWEIFKYLTIVIDLSEFLEMYLKCLQQKEEIGSMEKPELLQKYTYWVS